MNLISGTRESFRFLKVVQRVLLDGVFLTFRAALQSTVTKDCNSVAPSHAISIGESQFSSPSFSLKRMKGKKKEKPNHPNLHFFLWLADFQDKEDCSPAGTAAGACSPNSQKRTPHTEKQRRVWPARNVFSPSGTVSPIKKESPSTRGSRTAPAPQPARRAVPTQPGRDGTGRDGGSFAPGRAGINRSSFW